MRVSSLVLLCALSLPVSGRAEDLDMPKPQDAFDLLAPDTMADAHPRWRGAAAQAGAAWGGFLAWPSLGAGALVDSNPLQRHVANGAATGLRLTPRLVIERESGVHASAFYGAADARLYPARPDADQLDGRIGVLHDWAPRRDLILRLQGELSQARDPLDSRVAVTGTARGDPFTSRTASATASMQKSFEALFVSLGGGVARSTFTGTAVRTTTGAPGLSAETGTEIKARVGARLGPALFVFAEPAANWRVLDAVSAHSQGSRVVAGLGVGETGLLGGEVYAGAQRQDYTLRPRTVAEPVFGGRLSWSPDPAWTATLAVDRGLEQARVGTAAQPLGTPLDVVRETAALRAAPSRFWSGELALQHATVRYFGSGRTDDLLGAEAALAVPWRHDLDILADLNLTRVRSSLVVASYSRAVATLGLRYRY